jgi:hypothetical protein
VPLISGTFKKSPFAYLAEGTSVTKLPSETTGNQVVDCPGAACGIRESTAEAALRRL